MRPTCLILPLLLGACSGGPMNPSPADMASSPGDLAARKPLAVIATSDFVSGTLASLDLGSRAVEKSLDTIDPQSIVRAYGGLVYVLDQSHGVLRIYDPAKAWKAPVEIATGNGQVPAAQSNPHDLYVDGAAGRAFVTLYGSFGSTAVTGARALGVLDLKSPDKGIVSFLPLQVAAADKDGNPDADRILPCGGKLYVTLQDLDRTSMYAPAGPARLAVIDPAQPQGPAEYIQLAGQNPVAITAPGGACAQALVGHGDNQLAGMPAGKGGIERVDLPGKRSLGLLLSDTQLGGNVSALDATEARAFVSLISKKGADFQHEVFPVDLQGKQKGARVLGPLNYVAAIRVSGDELLVLSAGTPAAGQVKVGLYSGAASGAALPEQPLDLGLPPLSIDVLTF